MATVLETWNWKILRYLYKNYDYLMETWEKLHDKKKKT